MKTIRRHVSTADKPFRAEYWMGFRWNFNGGYDTAEEAIAAAKSSHAAYGRPVRVPKPNGFMETLFTLGEVDPNERCSV